MRFQISLENKSPSTSVVQENAATLFCHRYDGEEIILSELSVKACNDFILLYPFLFQRDTSP